MRYLILFTTLFFGLGAFANSDVGSCHQALSNTGDFSLENGLFFYQPSERRPGMRAPIYIVKDGNRLLECRSRLVTSTVDGLTLTEDVRSRLALGQNGGEMIAELPPTVWPARNLLVDGRTVATVTYDRETERDTYGVYTVGYHTHTIASIDRISSSSSTNASDNSSECTDVKNGEEWEGDIFDAYQKQVRDAYRSWQRSHSGEELPQCSSIAGFNSAEEPTQQPAVSAGNSGDNES